MRVGMSTDLGRCQSDRTFLSVNRRPVQCREVEKLLRRLFSQAARVQQEKFPVCSLAIGLEGALLHRVDHNLEPNKQRVGLGGCLPSLLKGLETILGTHWGLALEVTYCSYPCCIHPFTQLLALAPHASCLPSRVVAARRKGWMTPMAGSWGREGRRRRDIRRRLEDPRSRSGRGNRRRLQQVVGGRWPEWRPGQGTVMTSRD